MFVNKCYSHVIVIAFLNVITLICSSSGERRMCRDDSGKPVDWYIAYKPPTHKSPTFQGSGSHIVYMDDGNPNWRLLNSSVSNHLNPMAYTLNSIYTSEGEDSMYAMYNDQIPPGLDTGPCKNIGHTKGVINFDLDSGFWMIHSVPKFPQNKSFGRYHYPDNGFKYGQMFHCLSLNYKFLDTVGELFRFNHPQFYDFILPQKFKDSNPNLTAALEGKYLDTKDLLVRPLTSLKGQKFTGFAKSASYGGDLWTGIADSLKSSLAVESWRNYGRNMRSKCNLKYTVENVLGINLLKIKFNSTKDHSKWAVSKKAKSGTMNKDVIVFKQNESDNWICVGDINRQEAQRRRAGGAVCFHHPGVAVNFQNIEDDMERCRQFI